MLEILMKYNITVIYKSAKTFEMSSSLLFHPGLYSMLTNVVIGYQYGWAITWLSDLRHRIIKYKNTV